MERDLEVLSRYVEFSAENFDCYSLEMARVLMAAGAEVDVVCRLLCKKVNPDSTADNINAYRGELLAAYQAIPAFEVVLPRFGLTLQPWDEWGKPNGVPFWWTAYNKTKHHRDSEFQRANLKNTLNAVSGLFVVALYLYKQEAEAGELLPGTQQLRAGERHYGGTTHNGYEFGVNYLL